MVVTMVTLKAKVTIRTFETVVPKAIMVIRKSMVMMVTKVTIRKMQKDTIVTAHVMEACREEQRNSSTRS
jgi:hypothetical protein